MQTTIRCVCSHHETDTVVLRDRLDFRQAASIKGDIVVMKIDNPDSTPGAILAVLSEGYLRQGIESWSLVGQDSKPLPVTQSAIEEFILANIDVAMELADVADDLYAKSVMLPLLGMASPSSQATPTATSTSQEPSSSREEPRPTSPTSLPTRSRPSSTSTTPTADTVTTTALLDGDSNSSRSSATAA